MPSTDPVAPAERDLAAAIKGHLSAGETARARELFGHLVQRHQRRATRIAYSYLRDPAEVDEAVQDAFLKVFLHLPTFREELRFELWFTRIIVNTCLDRLKARTRRRRWLLSSGDPDDAIGRQEPARGPSPEARLLERERADGLARAIDRLPERQRTVVVLSQLEGYSTREIGEMLGLNDATVRVHLFRAIRSLRRRLRGDLWQTAREPATRQAI